MIRFLLSSLPYIAHVKPVNAVASRASSSRPEITHYAVSAAENSTNDSPQNGVCVCVFLLNCT